MRLLLSALLMLSGPALAGELVTTRIVGGAAYRVHETPQAQRYAIVIDGVVQSVTGWDPASAPDWRPPAGKAIQVGPDVAAGDLYDAKVKTFSRPEPAPVAEAAVDPAAEIKALKDALIKQGVITDEAVEAEKAATAAPASK